MYRFFRLATGIPSTHLPDYDSIFKSVYFSVKEEKHWMRGFIQSKLLQQTMPENE